MSVSAAILLSGAGLYEFGGGPVKSNFERAIFSQVFPPSFHTHCRGVSGFVLPFNLSKLPVARYPSEFACVAQYQIRASSSSSWSSDNHGSPDYGKKSEENLETRDRKSSQFVGKAMGVAVIACSMFVLRARVLAKKPLSERPVLTMQRLVADKGDNLECNELPETLSLGTSSDFGVVKRTGDPPVLMSERSGENQQQNTQSTERSTSIGPTFVNLDANQWLVEVKDAAMKKGVRESVIGQALQGVRPSKLIMELDSTQPELKLTLEAYLKNMINAYRVNKGVSGFQENELLLAEISSKYGIPSPVLVSIWGIESSYGGYSGSWDVLRALVTLAYASPEPRRAQFFRRELLQALQIIQDGHGPQGGARLKGSWAGAMGQCQFMPSSFQVYAVDYDGDGRKDIWESRADMFASMANYLKEHGWQKGGLVAQKVQIPESMDKKLIGLNVQKSVHEWRNKYKVQVDEGQPKIPEHEMASLLAPDGPNGSSFLVFQNFRTIMRYNTSPLYTIAVWQLALQIIDGLGSSAAAFPELVSTLRC